MSKGTTKGTASAEKVQDAIVMLMADHKKVKTLFSQFQKLKEGGGEEEKTSLVQQICTELKIHTQIEEEIFYPAVRKAIEDADLMDEALVEHAGAKELVAQLEEADPADDLYDAKVTVLGEQIDHHVKEEEGEMFPKAKKAKVDTESLGKAMTKRKQELQAEMGMAEAEQPSVETGKARRTAQR